MRKRSTSNAVSRHSLFGPPPILEGEDAAAYDELFGRVCAAVKPADVIDEIFVADVVALEWEVLRWRRLKLSLLRARGLKALEGFLCEELEYDLYRKHFAEELTKILRDNLAVDGPLACGGAGGRNSSHAVVSCREPRGAGPDRGMLEQAGERSGCGPPRSAANPCHSQAKV